MPIINSGPAQLIVLIFPGDSPGKIKLPLSSKRMPSPGERTGSPQPAAPNGLLTY
jgi:hypothetical protein